MAGWYSKIPEKYVTGLYLIALSMFLLYDYIFLTRYPREPFQKFYMAGAALGVLVILIRFLNVKNEDSFYLITSALLLAAGFGYYYVRHSYYFLVLAVFMVGAHRVSDRALVLLYLVIASGVFIWMVGQYIKAQGIPAINSYCQFGGINSTDTQGMLFFILVAYLFIRGRRVTLIEAAAFAVVVIWFWKRTNAENNMYCAMAALAVVVLMKISTWLKLKWNRGAGVLAYLAAASFIICGIVMIALVANYDGNSANWVQLDRTLHARLHSPHNVFVKYPPNLWGSEFVVVGCGYDPSIQLGESLAKYGYTYIDSSYPQILVMHGYVIYAMIIGAMTGAAWRYAQRKDLYRVLLLAVIAVDCMAEGHLKEISCNIWLLCLLADLNLNSQIHNVPKDSIQPDEASIATSGS